MKIIELIGLVNVAMQRNRIELCKHGDVIDLGIDAIADRNIDQTILAGNWDRWLGSLFREWIKALSHSATQNHCENMIGRHGSMLNAKSETGKPTERSVRANAFALLHGHGHHLRPGGFMYSAKDFNALARPTFPGGNCSRK